LHEQRIGGEEFPWSGVTDAGKTPGCKIGIENFNRARIGIGIAGHLTQHPISSARIGKNDGWTKFTLGEVRERESN